MEQDRELEKGATVHENTEDDTQQPHDDIYNVRPWNNPLDRLQSTMSALGEADEDPGLRKPGDFKQPQIFRGRMLFWLAYQSIGVIYGDIGTSPLYVYSSTFSEAPSRQDLIGVLSIIIWSLVMMVTVKYVLVILRADNDGEGGTFSTYSLLSRYMNITHRDPREASLVQMKRYGTDELQKTSRHVRHRLESSKLAQRLLKVMGVLAVTMVLADGLLTPAQSVLGAVQGIQVVSPDISKGTIIGVTDAILVVLFLIQPLGITKLTFAFAPIVIIWLGFNAVFGTVYPALVIAILAAVVASQAIITATFQLLTQVMKLSYFPQIKVVHTSDIFHGQLYIPVVNWLLMIGTILVASIYNNPAVIIFFHLRPIETPSVPADDRYTVSRLAIPNCYRLVVRYGYNDEIITPNLAHTITQQVRSLKHLQLLSLERSMKGDVITH
ncbi:hypothetical protein BBP40_011997 [Aspergillus hancockii]|nr:hypothetical protein BBP40_011997 [Aspergillus hancockii]